MIEPSATEEVITEIPAGSVTEASALNDRPDRQPLSALSSDAANNTSADASTAEAETNSSGLMTELQRILFGDEQDKLRRLQHRLDDPKQQSEELSRVLPRAIRLRNTQDKQLTVALTSTVEDSIASSVRTNPKRLSDALYPIIGPAIRAAVSHTLGAMLQSLNETLNSSFSPQGFKWRLEALRTGKSFGEIVLLHTLLYRVEQAFLIHKQTGLLLLQAIAPAVAAQDPQLVSGMLTAIQDFVGDSFSVGKGDTLGSLEVGKLKVWIEQGPQAVLATVIRGDAPEELRNLFQEVLENIHRQHPAELEDFNGDAALFEISRPELERCLQTQLAEAAKKKISPLLVALLLLLLLLLGGWMFFSIRETRRWNDYVTRLQAEPGIVVVKEENRSHYISGLRDPLAADPAEILKSTLLDPASVTSHWEPYQALLPKFIEMRARNLLQPPESVTLKFDNGVLTASGHAPPTWIEEARRLALALPGVTQFHSALSDQATLRERIEKQLIDFAVGSAELANDQQAKLDRLAEDFRRLNESARNSEPPVRLEITGHSDRLGSDAINQKLREQRVAKVRETLAVHGVEAAQLVSRSENEAGEMRGVTFKVISIR